jgi:hypothetical protein
MTGGRGRRRKRLWEQEGHEELGETEGRRNGEFLEDGG